MLCIYVVFCFVVLYCVCDCAILLLAEGGLSSKKVERTGECVRVKVYVKQVYRESKGDIGDAYLLTHRHYKNSARC